MLMGWSQMLCCFLLRCCLPVYSTQVGKFVLVLLFAKLELFRELIATTATACPTDLPPVAVCLRLYRRMLSMCLVRLHFEVAALVGTSVAFPLQLWRVVGEEGVTV